MKKIDSLKDLMYKSIDVLGLSNPITVKISQELDIAIADFYSEGE